MKTAFYTIQPLLLLEPSATAIWPSQRGSVSALSCGLCSIMWPLPCRILRKIFLLGELSTAASYVVFFQRLQDPVSSRFCVFVVCYRLLPPLPPHMTVTASWCSEGTLLMVVLGAAGAEPLLRQFALFHSRLRLWD